MRSHSPQCCSDSISKVAGSNPFISQFKANSALKAFARLSVCTLALSLGFFNATLCNGQDNEAVNTRNNSDKVLRSTANVNPSTLGMELTIPLGESTGRGKTSLVSELYYSSKLWRMDTGAITHYGYQPIVNSIVPVFDGFPYGGGWTASLRPPGLEFASLRRDNQLPPGSGGCGGNCGGGGGGGSICFVMAFGYCICYGSGAPVCYVRAPPNTENMTNGYHVIYRIIVHMPDGSTHELVKSTTPTSIPPGGTENADGFYYALDGSNMRLDYAANSLSTLSLPDGSRYIFNHGNFNQGGQG